jgi:hypothetical protein
MYMKVSSPQFIVTLFLVVIPFICWIEPLHAKHDALIFGAALEGTPLTTKAIDNFYSHTGLAPSMAVTFVSWPAAPDASAASLIAASLEAAQSRGAIPVITWEPFVVRKGGEKVIQSETITKGFYDSYITAVGSTLAAHPGPSILRFAHEMNLQRYSWGCGSGYFNKESPKRYRRMFRYVVTKLREAGATRTLMCFCPNAESVPSEFLPDSSWNTISAWWPGKDVVDILGIDGYNWGTTRTLAKHGWKSRWRSFSAIFAKPVKELRSLAPDMNLIVMETASASEGGDPSAWAADAVRTARQWGINGIIWFHLNKETDWRLPLRSSESSSMQLYNVLDPLPLWVNEKREQ